MKASRIIKQLAIAAVATVAMMAALASAASAASWSSGYPVLAKGSMTFERADGAVPPVTCKVEESWTGPNSFLKWRCPSRTIQSYSMINPVMSGSGPGLIGYSFGPTENPWNAYYWYQPALGTLVVNGNASEPTRVSFNKQAWGNAYTGKAGETASVHATGTINFTTPSGGLTTIVP